MKREVDLGSVVGPQGAEGKSAYEVWKEQPGNEGKTEAEYLAAMKGEKGNPGEKGEQGEVGPTGKTGLSAYETWKAKEGNEEKTEEEFLESLKGAAGEKGETGPQGEAFTIAKAYASIEEMNEGFATDGVKEGQFVVIETGNVDDEDNAKLYVKGTEGYGFVTDLSGAQGLTGPQGPQGLKGETGEQGPAGETGATGADGKTPSFIIKEGHLYAVWED